MMVEVFKTNVQEACHARVLIDEIEKTYRGYTANFDLEDCDKILRVVSPSEAVEVSAVIDLLKTLGFHAEVLSDDIPELLPF